MIESRQNVVLIFEFYRTEEERDGVEIARIERRAGSKGKFYAAQLATGWETIVDEEELLRSFYIRRLLLHLTSASQSELEYLFEAGSQVSTGPVRGRLSFPHV